MMAGNPSNWWSTHSNLRSSTASDHHQHETEVVPTNTNLLMSQTDHPSSLLPLQFLHGGSSSSSSSSTSSLLPFISSADHHASDFPQSWSQLLMGGLPSEQEERFSPSEYEATRVLGGGVQVDVKQEASSQSNNNLQLYGNHQFQEEQEVSGVSNRAAAAAAAAAWAQIMPASSPKSCITTLTSNNHHNSNHNNNNNNSNSNNNNNNNSNMLDFSTNKRSLQAESHQHADHTNNSECNSTATTGGLPTNKKPRVQSSSTPPLKVRKEKLGDRITALHQLVSPFGKTDTASVLLEAIGYIRFLQGQIEALSSPYLGNNNASANNQHSVRHGERNCLFPDHPGQLLNDSCLKRRGAANQEENKDASMDLKTRGLCLVPISCTQLVGNDNGADYWAQSLGGGF